MAILAWLLPAYSAVEALIGKTRPLGAGSLPELLVILLFRGVTLITSHGKTTEQGGSNMTDSQQTVSVPQNSYTLAQALAKFTTDVLAAKSRGLSGASLIEAIGADAISDLAGAFPSAQGAVSEASQEPIGVAEAFTLAGFQVARSLTGK